MVASGSEDLALSTSESFDSTLNFRFESLSLVESSAFLFLFSGKSEGFEELSADLFRSSDLLRGCCECLAGDLPKPGDLCCCCKGLLLEPSKDLFSAGLLAGESDAGGSSRSRPALSLGETPSPASAHFQSRGDFQLPGISFSRAGSCSRPGPDEARPRLGSEEVRGLRSGLKMLFFCPGEASEAAPGCLSCSLAAEDDLPPGSGDL